MLLEEGVCYDQCIKKKKKTLYFFKRNGTEIKDILLHGKNRSHDFRQSEVINQKQLESAKLLEGKVKVKVSHVLLFAVHGILQARTLEWVAYTFSRGSSHPRD